MHKITTTVRIDTKTQVTLAEVAARTGESKREVLAKALEAYRRDVILRATNQGFATLQADLQAWQADLQAWQAEKAEREKWDATLSDGLDKDR